MDEIDPLAQLNAFRTGTLEFASHVADIIQPVMAETVPGLTVKAETRDGNHILTITWPDATTTD